MLKILKQVKRIEIYKKIHRYEDEIYLDDSIDDEVTYKDVYKFLLEQAIRRRKQRQLEKFINGILNSCQGKVHVFSSAMTKKERREKFKKLFK